MKIQKKLFFWFTTFLIVMACAPSLVTPLPPPNPYAVNTSIVETANAANTLTQAAMPPSPTYTPTLRNTATPESTFTPIPTIFYPSPTSSQRVQLFRVKHDSQLAEFNFQSRTAADDWPVDAWGFQTPEVVSLFIDPHPRSGTNRTTLDSSWKNYIDVLNNRNKQVLNYLYADWTALFDQKGFPYLESKTTGGNVIIVDELQGNWARVHTLEFKNPGSLSGTDYFTNPEVIHKMVVVKYSKKTKSTFWVNPPPGPIYWPLVSSRELWIPVDRLEPFPALPMQVTARITQDILKEPKPDGEQTGYEFAEEDEGQIIKYQLRGSDVWAQLSTGRWIALFRYTKNGATFYTNWEMATRPPP